MLSQTAEYALRAVLYVGAVHPKSVRVSEVAEAIDGTVERRCLLGRGRCGDTPGCTAHARWAPIATAVDAFFGKTTLADLLSPRTT